jgi:hypothetical protein
MELAWGWKVEEAPMAQLLGRSRCNGTARSTAVPWCRGLDKLPAVYTSGWQLSGRWARAVLTGWAGTVDMCWVQSGAQPFSNYSNFAPILKYKTKTILMPINVPTWHAARVDYSEQLLPLGPLPIPNRILVIKFGTNSTLNISLNF